MGILLDASTPTPKTITGSTSATIVSNSFSPPAGSLVVIAVGWGWQTTPASTTDACSGGGITWTKGPELFNSAGSCLATEFWGYFATAPGSITVTVTRTGDTTQAGAIMVAAVLTGASSVQTGAGSAQTAISGTTHLYSTIVTTVAGSWVVAAGAYNGTAQPTVLANSTQSASWWEADVTEGQGEGAWYLTGGSGAPGTVTGPGGTMSASTFAGAWTALEILPALPSGAPAQPGQTWRRHFRHSQQILPPSSTVVPGSTSFINVTAEAGGIIPFGTIQPYATIPVPRRKSARAVVGNRPGCGAGQQGPSVLAFTGSAAIINVTAPAGGVVISGTVQRPPTGIPQPRRSHARSVWAQLRPSPANFTGGFGSVLVTAESGSVAFVYPPASFTTQLPRTRSLRGAGSYWAGQSGSGGASGGTITVVHATLITGATSGTIPSTTAGNCLVAIIGTHSSGGTDVITGVTAGGAADNWASLGANGRITAGVANPGTEITVWIDPNCAGSQTTVALQGTAAAKSFIYLLEVTGMGSAPVLDAHNSALNTSGVTSWSSGASGTTATAAELVVGGVGFGEFIGNTDAAVGPASPWTNSSSYNDGTTGYMYIAGYRIASSTGTFTYNGTTTGSDFYTAIVLTIKPGGSFGGATSSSMQMRRDTVWTSGVYGGLTNLIFGAGYAGSTAIINVTAEPGSELVSGTVQPLSTRQPRRTYTRVTWRSGSGQPTVLGSPAVINVTAPAGTITVSGTVQPRATVPVPRRKAARTLWNGHAGTTAVAGSVSLINVTAPAGSELISGTVQPRATVPVPRRKTARAYWQTVFAPAFFPGSVSLVNVTAEPGSETASGLVQPWATVPVPRRKAARAYWNGRAGWTLVPGSASVVNVTAEAGLFTANGIAHGSVTPRKPQQRSRAYWSGRYGPAVFPGSVSLINVIAGAGSFNPPVKISLIAVYQRYSRQRARVYWTGSLPPGPGVKGLAAFINVTAEAGGSVSSGTMQPLSTRQPRRTSARSVWRNGAILQTSVAGSTAIINVTAEAGTWAASGTVQRLSTRQPRRTYTRVTWHSSSGPRIVPGSPAVVNVTAEPGTVGVSGLIQPLATRQPRRTAYRAVWRSRTGPAVFTGGTAVINVTAFGGTETEALAAHGGGTAVTRRQPSQVHGIYWRGTRNMPPQAFPGQPALINVIVPAGLWGEVFAGSTTVINVTAEPGTLFLGVTPRVPPKLILRSRVSSRAVWRNGAILAPEHYPTILGSPAVINVTAPAGTVSIAQPGTTALINVTAPAAGQDITGVGGSPAVVNVTAPAGTWFTGRTPVKPFRLILRSRISTRAYWRNGAILQPEHFPVIPGSPAVINVTAPAGTVTIAQPSAPALINITALAGSAVTGVGGSAAVISVTAFTGTWFAGRTPVKPFRLILRPRTSTRAVWQHIFAGLHYGPPGTLQPLATRPSRRTSTRACWQHLLPRPVTVAGATAQVFVTAPAGAATLAVPGSTALVNVVARPGAVSKAFPGSPAVINVTASAGTCIVSPAGLPAVITVTAHGTAFVVTDLVISFNISAAVTSAVQIMFNVTEIIPEQEKLQPALPWLTGYDAQVKPAEQPWISTKDATIKMSEDPTTYMQGGGTE